MTWRAAGGVALAIEASTYTGTVAVVRDGVVLAWREVAMRGEREERLMPAVVAALGDCGVAPGSLARVACGAGPGSFTSLRIAASIAKGIALGAGVPLVPVPSSALMLLHALPSLRAESYLTVIDALRGERFIECFEVGASGRVRPFGAAARVPDDRVEELAREHLATTLGPGMAAEARPDARGVALLGAAMPWPEPVELAAWEPDYGRLAEAQVKWEAAHGRPLAAGLAAKAEARRDRRDA